MFERDTWLKPNVIVEPLWNQWYAWAHLVSPLTAAMHVVNQLKIMRSYVSAPEFHAAACRDPALMGGPFIDYGGGRVDEIRALADRTEVEQADLLRLADAIVAVHKLLAADAAQGTSIEGTYGKLPDALKGRVELTYDLNHHANVRFLERLFYRSPFYKRAAQSVAVSLLHGDARPFFLSTPSLPDDRHLMLSIPFDDATLDAIAMMKREPVTAARARELLRAEPATEALIASLLTTTPPRRAEPYAGREMRVRYFGHATVLMEAGGVSVLTDPGVSYETGALPPRFTYADLPERIHYACITHAHQDHMQLECLLQLRHRIDTIVVPRSGRGTLQDPNMKICLEELGFRNVVELGDMDELKIPGGRITALPSWGEHADLDIGAKCGYHVDLGGSRVAFLSDSRNVDPRAYEHVFRWTGPVDSLFIGMECDGAPLSWLYGPLFPAPLTRKQDQTRRTTGSDAAMALEVVRAAQPRRAYVYAMGQEPWYGQLMALVNPDSRPIKESSHFIDVCRARGIQAHRPFCKDEFVLAA